MNRPRPIESSTLLPKRYRNHMLPRRCSQEPWRNIDVNTFDTWRPGSVRHTRPSPTGIAVPGGTRPVSSPGISPRSQTDAARLGIVPAPCRNSQASTLSAMSPCVTIGVRCVWFSSW